MIFGPEDERANTLNVVVKWKAVAVGIESRHQLKRGESARYVNDEPFLSPMRSY